MRSTLPGTKRLEGIWKTNLISLILQVNIYLICKGKHHCTADLSFTSLYSTKQVNLLIT